MIGAVCSGFHRAVDVPAATTPDHAVPTTDSWERTITAGSEEATPTALSKIESNVAPRLRLRSADRLIFVWLYRLYPSLLEAAVVFKPETLVRWHRSGSRL